MRGIRPGSIDELLAGTNVFAKLCYANSCIYFFLETREAFNVTTYSWFDRANSSYGGFHFYSGSSFVNEISEKAA